MEVAVMSLSPREQEALSRIENGLAGSDPELAGRLATFTRLTSGEAMPAREEMQTGTRRARRPLAASTRLTHAMAVLWVLIAVGMIAAAMSLSGNGKGGHA
jgi:type VI protein secretion system component VasF